MPAKLKRCVEHVMKQGKPKSNAFAICVASTGQKPHKKKKGK
jgi:hypothetical protein